MKKLRFTMLHRLDFLRRGNDAILKETDRFLGLNEAVG